MANHALIVAALGLCAALIILGSHIWQGLQLKKQVDRDYHDLKAMDKAFEERVLEQIRKASR